GEEFSINVTFPEDYQVDELAGKEAEFKITIHEIKERILPELNDEFVQDVSEDAETVEDYRKEISENLAEDLKKARDADIEEKAVNALIDLVEADIPQAMYENKIDDMLREFEYRLSMQGLDLETYIQYTGLTTDSFREQYADEAEKRVKVRMALEKIAEIENIEVSDEELQAEYDKLSENHNMSVDAIKGIIKEKDLRKDLQVGKAMDLVKENANIK
ncbi:MAG: trigger factor, partial [Butyrivibrio sp.]|nr:trigger factor [Butyrivibrio sp.]